MWLQHKKRFKNKFRAVKHQGYPSISQYVRAQELFQLEKEGKIKNLVDEIRDGQKAVTFIVTPDNWNPIKYRADYIYTDLDGLYSAPGTRIVEDCKGKILPEFKLKIKLLKSKYPDICFKISKARYQNAQIHHFDVIDYPEGKKREQRNPKNPDKPNSTSRPRKQSKTRKRHRSKDDPTEGKSRK